MSYVLLVEDLQGARQTREARVVCAVDEDLRGVVVALLGFRLHLLCQIAQKRAHT